jgi:predicted acetyltransferase
MAIEIRPPTDEEWPAVCRADGRAFGVTYTPEEIEERLPFHDLSRFRVGLDHGKIVGVAGSYALEVTLPGGASVPMGGVTWVSSAATHRRQGVMRSVVGAVHDDIDSRGEPVASLYASEGGIYEHVGYGIATSVRVTSIDTRAARVRDAYRCPPGSVRYMDGDEVLPIVSKLWELGRRQRPGEVGRSHELHQRLYDMRAKPMGDMSAASYLLHADGYATYRTEPHWNDGHPSHTLQVVEMATLTPEAHAALWQTLLSIDLVGEIKSRALSMDDPLPYLLENQRVLRTTDLNDGVWVNVRDIATAFGARTYRIADRIVVEVDGTRWAIEGGPDGGTCKTVRSRADLVTSHSGLSSLLYGGVLPSSLVAGRRMTARNAETLSRADIFFSTSLLPHCQTAY